MYCRRKKTDRVVDDHCEPIRHCLQDSGRSGNWDEDRQGLFVELRNPENMPGRHCSCYWRRHVPVSHLHRYREPANLGGLSVCLIETAAARSEKFSCWGVAYILRRHVETTDVDRL